MVLSLWAPRIGKEFRQLFTSVTDAIPRLSAEAEAPWADLVREAGLAWARSAGGGRVGPARGGGGGRRRPGDPARGVLKAARRYDVPVVRDAPLAHTLFAVDVGRYIPRDLYEAVAEVLLFASRLRREAASAE